MRYTVSGKYRRDAGHEHGELEIKKYSIEIETKKRVTQGEVIVRAAELLQKCDTKFDSLKTHLVEEGVELKGE